MFASLLICPEKISEILERLPGSAWEAGALACEPWHLMLSVHWGRASCILQPFCLVSELPDQAAGCALCCSSSSFSPATQTALPLPPAFPRVSVITPVGPFVVSTGSRFGVFFKQSLHLAYLRVAVQTPLLRHTAQQVFYSFLEVLLGFAGSSCTQVPGGSILTCWLLWKQLSKGENPTSLLPQLPFPRGRTCQHQAPALGVVQPSLRLPWKVCENELPVQVSQAEVLLQGSLGFLLHASI